MSARRPDCAVWLGAAFLAGYLHRSIWPGRTAPRHWGSSWQPGTQKAPKAQLFAAAFGTRFAVGALQLCAVLLCGFCIWGIGLLVLFFAVRGGFSASAQPPWQRPDGGRTAALPPRYGCIGCCHAAVVSVAGRMVGAVGCTTVLCRAGARHKGNAGNRAAAFEPFLCGCNGFCQRLSVLSGCPRPCCRRRAMRAFPPHTSGWPAGEAATAFF